MQTPAVLQFLPAYTPTDGFSVYHGDPSKVRDCDPPGKEVYPWPLPQALHKVRRFSHTYSKAIAQQRMEQSKDIALRYFYSVRERVETEARHESSQMLVVASLYGAMIGMAIGVLL